jgi:ABC-type sugar transport system substrate-binding protein
MRNATPRVADTGEKKAGQTYQLTDLTTKSKAAAHVCQGARIGFRLAFGALALSALATFAGLPTSARAADEILIGLVTKTEVNPYFVKLRQAATAEAEKHGAKLLARFGKFDGATKGKSQPSRISSAPGSKGF